MPRASVIAIDGPVAAGKTTVGIRLSKELGYRFLDTGIMYRAVTWLALKRRVSLDDEEAIGELAHGTVIRLKEQAQDTVVVDGREVSEELRGPEVDQAVSLVARVPEVRSAMVAQQREIAVGQGIVVVGRDIGTVVLPFADLKVFLLASVFERAKRRHEEMTRQGYPVEYEKVLKDIEARDAVDSERAHSPLRPAEDARLLDTDSMDVGQVVREIVDIIGMAHREDRGEDRGADR